MKDKLEILKIIYERINAWEVVYKPYWDLLNEALGDLSETYIETVYTFAKALGVDKEIVQGIEDLCYDGKAYFVLNNGEDFVAHTIEEYVWALEH